MGCTSSKIEGANKDSSNVSASRYAVANTTALPKNQDKPTSDGTPHKNAPAGPGSYTNIEDFKPVKDSSEDSVTLDRHEPERDEEAGPVEAKAEDLLKGYQEELKKKGMKKSIAKNKNIVTVSSRDVAGSLIDVASGDDEG